MTPTQLRAFATIARHGTSRAAATELGVSEAAVSGHVAALRKELGDELFIRSGSGLSFTPGGLRLASRAVEMLGLQDRTRDEVRTAAEGRRILRLAVSSLFAECAAPGLIELFSARASDLDVEMSVSRPQDFVGLLTSRAVDVAIGPASPGETGVVTTSMFLRYQLVLVVGSEHPLAGRRPSAAEVAGHTWLLGPSAIDPSSATSRILRHHHVPESNQQIFQNHAAALNEARAGRGVALWLNHLLAGELDHGGLVRVQTVGGTVDGLWAASRLTGETAGALSHELVRFVSTPRAIQAMLTGSGANIGRFRPRVHVTLWS